MQGLGIQLETIRRTTLLLPFASIDVHTTYSKTFIDLASISDIVINEGISRWEIIYYLVVVRKGAEVELRVVFPVSRSLSVVR